MDKILIVDDNIMNLKLYSRVLNEDDRVVLSAESGKRAIQLFEENPDIALILMDVQMPGLNGLETLDVLVNEKKLNDIPVIFITGFMKSDEYVVKSLESGAYDYLLKPVDNKVLKKKIELQLTLSKQKRLLKQKSVELASEREKLKSTLGALSEGVITTGPESNIILVNKSALNIFSIKEKSIIDQNIVEVLSPFFENDGINYFKEILNCSKKENNNYDNIFNVKTADGEKKIISVNCTSVLFNQEEEKRYIFVVKDITEKITIENNYRLAQKMESVGRLAAGISHEINTPMQFVGDNTHFLKDAFSEQLNFIQKLKEILKQTGNNGLVDELADLEEEFEIEYLQKEIPNAIERNMEGIRRVSEIVLAMKDFAHPSGKKKSMSNINKGIETTLIISKNEWKYDSELKTELDADLPLVNCNLEEINQVVLNMIINSVHSIKEKKKNGADFDGNLEISTHKNENSIEIIISDNGAGIKKSYTDKIFDPFFTTKEVGKGTGQGLAIAHDIIVNKHHGKINFETTEGQGTIFKIELPIK